MLIQRIFKKLMASIGTKWLSFVFDYLDRMNSKFMADSPFERGTIFLDTLCNNKLFFLLRLVEICTFKDISHIFSIGSIN